MPRRTPARPPAVKHRQTPALSRQTRERRRPWTFHLWVTPAERELARRHAALTRQSLTAYAIHSLAHGIPPPRAPLAALRLYGRIGRTIEELHHVLVRLADSPDAAERLAAHLTDLGAELAELRRQLTASLRDPVESPQTP